jgi:hypothetical protein
MVNQIMVAKNLRIRKQIEDQTLQLRINNERSIQAEKLNLSSENESAK